MNADTTRREGDFSTAQNTPLSTARGELSTGRAGWLCGALALVWGALSLAWLHQDRGLPDGDALGHIGTAALFVFDLREGAPLRWLARLWYGDTGEYPGLYPAIFSLPWTLLGEGQPGRLPLRALNLGWALLGAWAAGRIATRFVARERAGIAFSGAFLSVLLLPEGNGLARAFMPEGALAGWTALTLLATLRAVEQPTRGRVAALGLALGLGLLLKQTFVIYALVPALWAVWKLRRRAIGALLVGGAVAGPWYATHLGAQLAYGAASAPADGSATLAQHLAYYPMALAWTGLGPVLLVALVLGVFTFPRARAALPLATLLLGLLLLAAVPKKYPRLIAPLGPVAATLLGVALASTRRPLLELAGWGGLATAGLVAGSLTKRPPPVLIEEMARGCVQRWLRPPQTDDFGLPEVAAAARANPADILVIDAPETPCETQTTLPWIAHLRPWLEHEGLENGVLEPADAGADAAGLIIDWRSGPGQLVEVPALGARFWIRALPPRVEAW